MAKLLDTDPRPNQARAKLLLQNNRRKVVDSLNMLVDACEDTVDKYFYHLIKRQLNDLKQGLDLNPMLFRLSAKLVEAVESTDVPMAVQQLQTLALLSSEEFFPETMRYLIADAEYVSGTISGLLDEIGDDTFSFNPKPVSRDNFHIGISTVEACLEVMKRCTPELYAETLVLTQRICLYEIDPLPDGSTMHSGSKLDYLGCIFLNADMSQRPWYFWADKIVHEAAHQVLLSIMLEEEVVLNPDHERYSSPLRAEGRTVTGIYHAAFVIYRIIYFFDAVLDRETLSPTETSGMRDSLIDYVRKFHDAHQIIMRHGNLTSFGNDLMTLCEAEVRGFEVKHDKALV